MDAHSLQTLIDRHGAALQLVARQWCRAPEDAVQEALIELVHLPTAPRDPAAWLYTVVRRKAMNIARAESRRRRHQRDAGRVRETWFEVTPADDPTRVDCQGALADLPLTDRVIVILRIWGEQTFAQIAAVVELPTSTVHRRYQAALDLLESIIQSQTSSESPIP